MSYIPRTINNPDVAQQLQTQDEVWSLLKENLHKAINRMKHIAIKKRTKRVFKVGDWVFLKIQPFWQKTLALRHNMRLAPRYYGPFKIVQWIGSVAYQMDLPLTSRIHPVFHISLLKQKLSTQVCPLPIVPLVDSEGVVLPVLECILQQRMKKANNRAITKVLIKWKGAEEVESRWESLRKLHQTYPHLKDTIW